MSKKYEVFESTSAVTMLRTVDILRNKSWISNSNFKLKHFIFKKDDPFLMQPTIISNILIAKIHILIENNSEWQEISSHLDKKFNHIGPLFLPEPEKNLEAFSVFLESKIKSLKNLKTLECC